MSKKPTLDEVCRALETIAPLALAEDWDNVGLLIEGRAAQRARIGRIFLCIDLSRPVLTEALAAKADLVVAYHPPIFGGLKRLGRGRAKEEIVLDAVRAGLSVYSPHTALDATPGGVNDWLAEGLGLAGARAIQPRDRHPDDMDTKVVVFVPENEVDAIRAALTAVGCGVIGAYADCSYELLGEGTFRGLAGSRPTIGRRGRLERVREIRLEMVGRSRDRAAIEAAIRAAHSYEEPAFDLLSLRPRLDPARGQGRIGAFTEALPLSTLVRRVKKRLGLQRLRLATPLGRGEDPMIRSAAVCAGAGASVLLGAPADLYLSGEMRHHDVLDCIERGIAVILCDHSNTERGYLDRYAERIGALLPALEILRSEADRDPLAIV
ncbi:MAG: Nif3-like dinuclear metal center hexameric protein [Planctomycetes bacterium]|nr:Nif3-like dinuclear metal center hexameric protein [Planctomycetota bacterium]